MISAEIIADSLNTHGQRLTTFLLVFPRIVLAEFNTHRALSRNSASSRAIPFEKMLERVKNDPFIPIKWMKDHPGMQGNEYFPKEWGVDLSQRWLKARDYAIQQAELLSNVGVTKQFCNRLLEPFMWHTAIVTATEWENFFSLRAHPDAEIHIQELARKMLETYNNSQPKKLQPGEWHIPFGDKMDYRRVMDIVTDNGNIEFFDEPVEQMQDLKVKIATARCARLSYLNYEGKDDYLADIKLHDRLATSGHWSPFEHCAKAMTALQLTSLIRNEYTTAIRSEVYPAFGWCGNFRGFIQYRKTFQGENRKDERVKKIEHGQTETPNQHTTNS